MNNEMKELDEIFRKAVNDAFERHFKAIGKFVSDQLEIIKVGDFAPKKESDNDTLFGANTDVSKVKEYLKKHLNTTRDINELIHAMEHVSTCLESKETCEEPCCDMANYKGELSYTNVTGPRKKIHNLLPMTVIERVEESLKTLPETSSGIDVWVPGEIDQHGMDYIRKSYRMAGWPNVSVYTGFGSDGGGAVKGTYVVLSTNI